MKLLFDQYNKKELLYLGMSIHIHLDGNMYYLSILIHTFLQVYKQYSQLLHCMFVYIFLLSYQNTNLLDIGQYINYYMQINQDLLGRPAHIFECYYLHYMNHCKMSYIHEELDVGMYQQGIHEYMYYYKQIMKDLLDIML